MVSVLESLPYEIHILSLRTFRFLCCKNTPLFSGTLPYGTKTRDFTKRHKSTPVSLSDRIPFPLAQQWQTSFRQPCISLISAGPALHTTCTRRAFFFTILPLSQADCIRCNKSSTCHVLKQRTWSSHYSSSRLELGELFLLKIIPT